MPVKPRKIPLRMCVGCREMKPKMELVRVVKPQDGEAHIDLSGKSAGRGAYVCHKLECLRRAQKTKALERALETRIDENVFRALEEDMLGEVKT